MGHSKLNGPCGYQTFLAAQSMKTSATYRFIGKEEPVGNWPGPSIHFGRGQRKSFSALDSYFRNTLTSFG